MKANIRYSHGFPGNQKKKQFIPSDRNNTLGTHNTFADNYLRSMPYASNTCDYMWSRCTLTIYFSFCPILTMINGRAHEE